MTTSNPDLRHWMTLTETLGDRLSEDAESLEQRLAALIKRRDELMRQWDTVIKPTQPPEVDWTTAKWHGETRAQAAALDQWWRDPAQGGFWPDSIYPVNQEIERVQAEIKQHRRTTGLQNKRGTMEGFDTSEVLYHGTNAEFEVFDRKMAHTAAHIYTSPDLETAEGYGDHVYAVYGRQKPQADLTAEYCDYQLLRKVYRKGGYKRNHQLGFKDLVELVTNAQLYNYDYKGRFQDKVIDDCLGLGYRSVRITDGKPGGGYSDSVIFGSPDDLQIIEKVE